MVFVKMLTKLLKDPTIGKLIVPIVPDEARTFGMESLFKQVGIYSSIGQLYEPVDKATLLYYKEAKDGQILEEGITEAGSISSWIAAGTAYASQGVNTIPFFIFYSMFGFQRVGDFIWAAADARTKGFLLGGTAGRTTLAGEGLQHQDGQSHVLALSVPTCRSYDPAFAYELAAIVQDGIKRMYIDGEDAFYYITVMNEQYDMPPMPAGVHDGIIKGLYRYSASSTAKAGEKATKFKAQLLGSGTILNEVIKAQGMLEPYGVAADVWSATSYNELYRDGHARRSLESPAPNRNAQSAVRHRVPGEDRRRGRRRVRLPEEPGRHDFALGWPADGHARHRWLWPFRGSRIPPRLLRSGRPLHRHCHAVGASSAGAGGRQAWWPRPSKTWA